MESKLRISPDFSEFEHSQQFPGWKWKPSSRCHTKQGVNFPLLTTNYTYCILFTCRVQMWVLETLFGITGPPTGTTAASADLSSDLNTSSTWIRLVGQTMKYIYSQIHNWLVSRPSFWNTTAHPGAGPAECDHAKHNGKSGFRTQRKNIQELLQSTY